VEPRGADRRGVAAHARVHDELAAGEQNHRCGASPGMRCRGLAQVARVPMISDDRQPEADTYVSGPLLVVVGARWGASRTARGRAACYV
jgi:hypothetical protein